MLMVSVAVPETGTLTTEVCGTIEKSESGLATAVLSVNDEGL
jgi:hypothetical protein